MMSWKCVTDLMHLFSFACSNAHMACLRAQLAFTSERR